MARARGAPRPRVFDAFMFAGELELLETRLNVLSSVVDVFVIVEADVAHSGRYRRDLVFPAVKERFRSFLPRIRYRGVRASETPPKHGCARAPRGVSAKGAMECEHFLRGSLLREVLDAGARPTDILVSSDADEIPKPAYLRALRDCHVFGPSSNLTTHPSVFIMLASMLMYNIGCHTGQNRWSYGPKVGAVFQFDLLRDQPWRFSSGMNYRRWGNTAESGPRWADSAWHLTNFMTPEALSRKLAGFFHFRDFGRADRLPGRLAGLMARCKSPYPSKYRRMRRARPELGSPTDDALAYIEAHFPALRAQPEVAWTNAAGERVFAVALADTDASWSVNETLVSSGRIHS